MDGVLFLIFQLVVLLFSVMVHEVAHGVVAYRLGDDTAKVLGRLTLNPMKHLDPIGSFLVPLFLFFASGGNFILGWAKPVPYNPYRLKNPITGAALIAIAGPATNFIMAVIFGVLIRIIVPLEIPELLPLVTFFSIIVFINILLGVFNLVPIPPLDGSKLLFALIPDRYIKFKMFLEQYGFYFLLFFLFFGFGLILPIVYSLYLLLAGPGGVF